MQRHNYEYEPTPNSAAMKVKRMVGTSKRTLELGSGPGAITRLLKENDCRVTALELDPAAIELVQPFCERIVPCNLNDRSWPSLLEGEDGYDVIVAGDVLEHLYSPWDTLGELQPLLAKDGCVVVSLPHLGHNAAVACLIGGEFEYQPWGLLDKTHIRFFGVKSIQKLFENAGFKIVDADFVVKMPEQTEFAKQWRRLPEETRNALSASPFGTVYQVVVKAVPQSAPGDALKLESIPVRPAPVEEGNRVLTYLLSFIGLRTRQKIAGILGRLGLSR